MQIPHPFYAARNPHSTIMYPFTMMVIGLTMPNVMALELRVQPLGISHI
jgi:hypothetical protein